MKISIIGAAGVRTPLIIKAILARQDKLGLNELSLMDIDSDHLELISALISPIEQSSKIKFKISHTINPRLALTGADYVIITFRVGGIESRIIDERVPLSHRVIGQETTGPGGFAMGLRSIPILLEYVKLMAEVCPNAWLINFSNPAGMLTEALVRCTSWRKVVGICDTPASMRMVVASVLGARPEQVYLDYFGLNHLGWIKRVIYNNRDYLPEIIQVIKSKGSIPEFPFDPDLICSLGLLPNEYLYYFYYTVQAVNNIIRSDECRGEQIARLNTELFTELREKLNQQNFIGLLESYQSYLKIRGDTYMVNETGRVHEISQLDQGLLKTLTNEGYAGVALNLIEALQENKPLIQIVNIPNQSAIHDMDSQDVVEIPTLITNDHIQPLSIGDIPVHCKGLIKQVKEYEHLTIEAAMGRSYQKARLALTIHPLVRDYSLAGIILNEYISKHQNYFPKLE